MIYRAVAGRAVRNAAVLDWLPVLVVPVVLLFDAATASDGKPITALERARRVRGLPAAGLRRHVSFPIQAPLLTAGIILVLWQLHPGSTVVLIPMVALFELALGGDRRRSLWMSLAIVPCVIVSAAPFTSTANLGPIVIRNLALGLLAIAAGDVIRSRRQSERQMAVAREQETLRRVADERLRIAHEIHDVVAHAMTAINVQAGVAAHLLEHNPGQAHGALRNIKRTSGEALNDLRATLNVLRDPSQTAPVGPTAGLHDLEPLTEGLSAAGVTVDLEVTLGDVPASVHSAGYRIVQEALTNIARHAQASSTRVWVTQVDETVTIEIANDGTARHIRTSVRPGMACAECGERADALGGTLEAAPLTSGGWQVPAPGCRFPRGPTETVRDHRRAGRRPVAGARPLLRPSRRRGRNQRGRGSRRRRDRRGARA